MSSDPCFSMADMYGSALIGESKGKEEKKSGSVAEDGEDEDAKMPLRTESIYNLAFIQRPTTAIITHGGAGDDADVADSTTILEEDEDERWSSADADALMSGKADVWRADDDGGGEATPSKGAPSSPGDTYAKYYSAAVSSAFEQAEAGGSGGCGARTPSGTSPSSVPARANPGSREVVECTASSFLR